MNTHQWIEYAVTKTTEAFKEKYEPVVGDLLDTVKNLASKNRSLKNEVALLRNKLADSKATSAKSASRAHGFKPSHELQQALTKSAALQKSLDHALDQEEEAWEQKQLLTIAARTKKLADEMSYAKALQSDYSTATAAINRKKQDVLTQGVDGFIGISGASVKGLFNQEDKTFFTFEQLFASTVEILGSEYQVVKADLSSIGAGHLYHLSSARGGHANA